MIFNIYFDFFTNARSSSGKEKITNKIKKLLTSQYGEDNVIRREEMKFLVRLESKEWCLAIFSLIEFSQSIGRQWIITEDIRHELGLWSNQPKIVGISSIGINLSHDTHYKI